jgi:hypothetical protein
MNLSSKVTSTANSDIIQAKLKLLQQECDHINIHNNFTASYKTMLHLQMLMQY